MKCTTIHYINSAVSKSVRDLLEQHIPELVESCKTAQYFVHIRIEEDIVCRTQSSGSIFEQGAMEQVFQPVFQQVYETRKPVVIFPYALWECRVSDPDFDQIQYMAVFPVQYGGKLAGNIGIAFFSETMCLTLREVKLIQEVINIYAQLILECREITFSIPETGVWICDIETSTIVMGPELCDMYGLTSEFEKEISFEAYVQKFVYPEDQDWVRQISRQLLSDEADKLKEVRYRIVRGDGQVRYILTQGISINIVEGHKEIYGFSRDITEQVRIEEEKKQHEQRIQHMAYYDPLTKLPNRRYLSEWLHKELRLARDGKSAGVVFFIDTDNLKMVNDTYGHQYGDKLIVLTGMCIVNTLESHAFVAHMSGDEFFVVLRGTYTQDQIRNIVEQLNVSLQEKHKIFGISFRLTASIGIAEYPKDGTTAEEIIKNVDNAMYAAKAEGKGHYRFYTPEMQHSAFEKIRLIESLYDALDNHEFSLVYQPQVAVIHADVVGFEALLRWNSAVHGLISPSRFMPLVEQAGLTRVVGEWVFKSACQFSRRLLDHGWNGCVHVNISPMQLAMEDFVDMLFRIIRETQVPSCHMGIEITEDACMTSFMSMEHVLDRLERVTAAGIHLAMDDFGTGYSSLTLLDRLPFDTIKIDKSFVDQIGTHINEDRLIASIIQMIHSLNKKVIAEGVETERQLLCLKRKRCDYIQGYVYSKPLTEQEAMAFLEARQE
ncbi:EAL domain-containing protein [Megasphaera paucivorans]|uniref:PAS domain S-box-containing protein/diguanylate cyclase (GGDEF) domain-containing protein n=1 Tax=Megasphaera paucivorans TaxID=349095 RepID=A0A1G9TVE0_9FIRM|nr:GGDEF domain-containing phosphodiesterase [Megasphaera paucivorans]SDM51384.1 PAS domain S-box-containing protein/diguanylate cyclase (GGDEF) domain-containing protein [Megasphaera paucivorans]